ncbi:RagB/SusD family nutrient uptake outer membrane protein [Membranicola marinus]|uniref:RagB/SusD family nutrient uptake outer membrane protein n=1 Tax=Membranihabitans marinus TaxID=1227546 RepID=A0A953L9S9_9BACT|nr:RagB/SusD family nutrient uptake outer membrane protein [Membranihabitans marinus]MBY5959145.1 RagB/SusD family nutrient uptake outer membrane protein [Membranihabitans marinus]
MKNIKSYPFLIAFGAFLFLYSCSEDWLKPKPKSFFTPENVYIEPEGFESIIITLRKNLKEEHSGGLHWIAQEFAASDLGSPWSQLDFYNLTPSSSRYYPFLSMFTEMYEFIKNANVIISRIDNIEWEDQSKRNRILGEALFHRAYWYYRLVHSYGDVPFIDTEIEEVKLDFQTHSRTAILNKLQKDLEYAAQNLPESIGPGEISKYAALHLLTKVYLADQEYDKAISASTEVIDGPFELMKERFGQDVDDPNRNVIWDLHRPKNFNLPNNTETILTFIDRYEAPPGARSGGLFTMRLYNPQWMQAQVKDSEGKPGMVADGPQYDSLGRGNANVRLTASYQYHIWNYKDQNWRNTSDLRRADINWVDIDELRYNNPESVDYGKVVNSDYFAQQLDTFKHLYAIPHYIMYVPMDDANARPVGGNGDWYLFRLAGTHLLRAEAYFWKGQLAEAATDLNVVRSRANALPVSADEVDIDFIMDERARELFAEEPRHSELVRVSYLMAAEGKAGYSLSSFSENNYYFDRVMRYNKTYEQKIELLGNTAAMAPFHVLWPIPDRIITANTLATINQNKGYDGAEKNVPPLETIE